MIRRITLQNYMSHVHTVIEPAAGLTVLVGPNNCGKSAVVSALETLCNNVTGDYMVRHDEKEAKVTIETDDEHTIVWKRRGRVVSYSIDGREIHRGRGSVPEDLHKLLRLPKVDAGEAGDPFDIHFGSQKSPIFLLNESESRAAVFFASSSDAAVLLEMQKRHRLRVKEQKSDEKRLTAEIATLDVQLGVLEPLKALAVSVEEVDGRYQGIQTHDREIQTIHGEILQLEATTKVHERNVERHRCLVSLMQSPEMMETDSIEQKIVALFDAENERNLGQNRYLVLETLASPPLLADSSALAIMIRSLVDEGHRLFRWSSWSTVFKNLDSPPVLEDAEALNEMCRNVSLAEWTRQRSFFETGCLARLQNPPTLAEIDDLGKAVRSIESAHLANQKCIDRQTVLKGLLSPPILPDMQPVAVLVSAIGKAMSDVARLEKLRAESTREVQHCETEIRNANQLRPDVGGRVPIPRQFSRLVVLAGSGFLGASIIALIFFIWPTWIPTFTTKEEKATEKSSPSMVAKSDGKSDASATPDTQNLPVNEPNEKPDKDETKKQELKNNELKKGETKKQEPKNNELKTDERVEATKLRLREVRQLLMDADKANAKGNYLDAVLGYGRAAVFYSDQLAAAENPEKIRAKFVNALSQYQAEVERAILKASERQSGNK